MSQPYAAVTVAEPEAPAKRYTWLRLTLLATLLATAWVIAETTGLRESMTQEGIRQVMADAGPLGAFAYLVAFALGHLAQLPGFAFVLAARVAYGPVLGFLLGYAGALFAGSVAFFVVRMIGGRAMKKIRWKWVERALSRLDDRPILTITLLRSVFWLSPVLTYALAMSSTRYRHFLAGSALGLVAPIGLFVFASDLVLSLLASVLG